MTHEDTEAQRGQKTRHTPTAGPGARVCALLVWGSPGPGLQLEVPTSLPGWSQEGCWLCLPPWMGAHVHPIPMSCAGSGLAAAVALVGTRSKKPSLNLNSLASKWE